MKILWIDPFFGGSHAAVASGYARHSRHHVELLTLSQAGGWRWRMRGAAITIAERIKENPEQFQADLIVTTDMFDLATFLGLVRADLPHTPTALYFHENQLTYPLPAGRKLDLALPWINYTAALAANALFFNSAFHREAFFQALPGLPGRFHDHQELQLIEQLHQKSSVLYPGMDLARFDTIERKAPDDGPPIILWNSRWEYDKNPTLFFEALLALKQRGIPFRVIVAGEHIDPEEPAFVAARQALQGETIWWGYAPDSDAYCRLLRRADLVVSTAIQEFFGIAVLEAIYAGCIPVLPARLSYPELIPTELHPLCLYQSDQDLADHLARLLSQIEELRQRNLQPIAARFDWRRQIQEYDRHFQQLTE